jgi:hypothetical protein
LQSAYGFLVNNHGFLVNNHVCETLACPNCSWAGTTIRGTSADQQLPLSLEVKALGNYIKSLQDRCHQNNNVEACLRQRNVLLEQERRKSQLDSIDARRLHWGLGSRPVESPVLTFSEKKN